MRNMAKRGKSNWTDSRATGNSYRNTNKPKNTRLLYPGEDGRRKGFGG